MIITKDEIYGKSMLPATEDRTVATRTSSLICWMAALWFFVSPWAYFGGSEDAGGINGWAVGAVMVAASMVRMIRPMGTRAFSLVNTLLSVWVLFSPWVFGYSENTGRLTNSLCVGTIILGFSILSWMTTKDVYSRIGTSDASEQEAVENPDGL